MDSSTQYQLISGCSADDAKSLAVNNTASFWGQAWFRILWEGRSLQDITHAMQLRLPKNLHTRTEVRRHEIVVREGEIVGYARWILSPSLADEWLSAKVAPVSAEDHAAFEKRYEQADWTCRRDTSALDPPIMAAMEKWTPKESHLQLDYLTVHPDHQRCGVASKLLESGLAQARRMQIKCFVMASSKDSLQLYTKYGFKCLDGFSQSLEPWGYTQTMDTFYLIKNPEEEKAGGMAIGH